MPFAWLRDFRRIATRYDRLARDGVSEDLVTREIRAKAVVTRSTAWLRRSTPFKSASNDASTESEAKWRHLYS
jgi:hypothetical protein